MESEASPRWRRLESLFHRAIDLPPEKREAFFESEAVNESLRLEVEQLLDCEARGNDAVADSLESLRADLDPQSFEALSSDDESSKLGPYRLLEPIGQGGLGTVYLAERNDGQFERQVAVKVVRRDLVTPRLLKDLRLERQILARLEHPHIARLYDGGTGPNQQPYLAMELITGAPIDRHCRDHNLGLTDRIELFLQVCAAVSYAHGSLVIHRDIKPSNILVTDSGDAKLLDFGIARFVEGRDGGETMQPTDATARRRLFTPDYASPEQIAGEPLATTTDVYSLGVVLYRLLTGRAPYRMKASATTSELHQSLLGPAPLSAAALEGSISWALRLRGDLEAIVAKAMAASKDDRYGAVQELESDLKSFLEHRPVSVREPSALYLLGRFLRRNRLAASASALTVTALSCGLVATTWSLQRAHQATGAAEEHLADLTEEQQRSKQLIESFVGMFRFADPGQPQGQTLSVRELIDRSTSRQNSVDIDPQLASYLAVTFGEIYLNLGSPEQAEVQLDRGLASAQAQLQNDDFIAWRSRALLAESRIDQGHLDAATGQLEGDIRRYRQEVGHSGEDLARLVHTLGVIKLHEAEYRAAVSLFRKALNLYLEAGSESSLAISETRHRLAQALMRSGDLKTSAHILRQVLAYRERWLGASHPASLTALGDLAAAAIFREDNDSAAQLLKRVVEGQRSAFGPDHPHVAVALQNLAVAERKLGRQQDAIAHLVEAVAIRRRIHTEGHPAVADALYGLARVYHQGGQLDLAQPAYSETLEIRRLILGDDHPDVAMTLLGIADLAWSRGQMERAEPLYREVIERLRRSDRDDSVDATFAYFRLGVLLRNLGETEAATWLNKAYDLRHGQLGESHPLTAKALAELEILQSKGSTAAASDRSDPAPRDPS